MSDRAGEPSLNPFKNLLAGVALAVTLASAFCLWLVSGRQPDPNPNPKDWNFGLTTYTTLTQLLSTLLGIGLLALIWEYVLRRDYAKSLHKYLALKTAIVSSGLQHLADTNSEQIDIMDDIAKAGIIRAIAKDPVDWIIRYFSAVTKAAQKREVHIELLFPNPESKHLAAVAASQGMTAEQLSTNIENAVETIKTRWSQVKLKSDNSSITVATIDLPLYDLLVADDTSVFEIHASTDHRPGMNGLALKFEGGAHPALWLGSQFDDAKLGAALWASSPPGKPNYFRSGL